jgi:hypothetical protein
MGRGVMAKIIFIVGVIGIVLGAAVLLISIMLVPITPSPGRSWAEEAMIVAIPGGGIIVISLALSLLGFISINRSRDK